jgi:hypothetical protein
VGFPAKKTTRSSEISTQKTLVQFSYLGTNLLATTPSILSNPERLGLVTAVTTDIVA